MTLTEAIAVVEQHHREVEVSRAREYGRVGGEWLAKANSLCNALDRVLKAAKRIDDCCVSHSGDVRCRHCYEL